MIRPGDLVLAKQIDSGLKSFEKEYFKLPGIRDKKNRHVLTEQLVESTRRSRYRRSLTKARFSADRADPSSDLFDPLKAAVLWRGRDDFDEACWLVFLSVAFGKNSRVGWQLVREIYRGAPGSTSWTWKTIANNLDSFLEWLAAYRSHCKATDTKIRFGNHRQREGLDPNNGVGATIRGYLEWIQPFNSHSRLFEDATVRADGDPKATFAQLYGSLEPIRRFGRLARFDYLTTLADLDFVDIQPGIPYMTGATGPLSGARLLFSNDPKQTSLSPKDLDAKIVLLDSYVKIGMHAWEDGLCNWQKSPSKFAAFRG